MASKYQLEQVAQLRKMDLAEREEEGMWGICHVSAGGGINVLKN